MTSTMSRLASPPLHVCCARLSHSPAHSGIRTFDDLAAHLGRDLPSLGGGWSRRLQDQGPEPYARRYLTTSSQYPLLSRWIGSVM